MESQIEAAIAMRKAPSGEDLNPEEAERIRKEEGLQMSRSRVLRDIEAAHNPRYRKVLERALAHLDHEIAQLSKHN